MTPIDVFGLLAALIGAPVLLYGYIRLVRPRTPFHRRERRAAVRALDAPVWWDCKKCGRSPGPHTHPDRTAEVWR